MIIALCLITNNILETKQMVATLPYAMVRQTRYELCISHQEPIHYEHLSKLKLPKGMILNSDERKRNPEKVFNVVAARIHSFNLASARADYLIMIDDDFRFSSGTKCYPWTSGERIMDACKYLEKNSSCGAVYLKGCLGGSGLKRDIVPMNGGFYDTGLGIVFRGRNRPYRHIIEPCFYGLGVGDDVAIAMTAIFHGYYVAKAFNSITRKRYTKKVIPIRPWKSKVNVASDKTEYNEDFLMAKGVFGKFDKVFGEFKHGKPLSKSIIAHYRNAAKHKNNEVAY